ncbi:conjugative transposon protein TraM [Maribacter sp. 2307ULW6-5]|uniref:conjugative transposon protein TraM n=1 Tax=Maribacter sp. 2307ULW6-5 TaxID=3386275 RepID=UPI0039BCF623
MQLDKKKVLFSVVLLLVLIYLISYSYAVYNAEEELPELTQPDLPKWEDAEENFESKKAALDAIKNEQERTPPSLYDEHMIDDKGYFNPDYMQFEKHRIIDSIYALPNFRGAPSGSNVATPQNTPSTEDQVDGKEVEKLISRNSQEIGLDHQQFFSTAPNFKTTEKSRIHVRVLGDQVLKKNSRIQLQLVQKVILNGHEIPRNTSVWGRVNFGPNRVFISVVHINHHPVVLEAMDQSDGLTGIYVENSFRSEATQEVLDGVVQDVNVPGLPQINGLRRVFQRSSRSVKVTVLDGHQLFLLPK